MISHHHLAAALMTKQISDELMRDTWRCHAEIARFSAGITPETKPDAEFWLRTFVRAFFAHVDGMSYTLRHLALFLNTSGEYPLTAGEQCVLREVTFRYRDGKVEEVSQWLRPIEGLELGFHHFSRAFGATVTLRKDDHRFSAFKRTLDLRHTLTHPKNPGDLSLAAAHISDFADAVAWFSAQMVALFSAAFRDILEAPSA